MIRNKLFWIVLIVAGVAVAGGYTHYNDVYAQPEESAEEVVQSTRVRQGDLVISASGSGELIPADDVKRASRPAACWPSCWSTSGPQCRLATCWPNWTPPRRSARWPMLN